MRCGDPNRWHRDCPLPWKEVLDFPSKSKGKGKTKGKGKGRTFISLDSALPAITEETRTGSEPTDPNQTASESPIDPNPVEEWIDETGSAEEVDDWWWSQYYVDGAHQSYVCAAFPTYKMSVQELNGHELSDKSPLILLDSGASITVAGEKWLSWWNPNHGALNDDYEIKFRFGNGPERPSKGSCVITILLPAMHTNQVKAQRLKIKVHIVTENVPLLISRDSLTRLGAMLDFKSSSLMVHNKLRIQLIKTPSGHLMLPGSREINPVQKTDDIFGNQVYATTLDVPINEPSKDELRKIHLHLGHCSEHTLITMLRAAHMAVPTQMITELYKECNCQAGIHRITPPNVPCWLSKYNGEVVAVDICYPFMESHPDINGGKSPALITVDCLSRFVNCTLLTRLDGECVTEAFLNDWVRP